MANWGGISEGCPCRDCFASLAMTLVLNVRNDMVLNVLDDMELNAS